MQIPESDWRLQQRVSRDAPNRFCTRVLDECAAILASSDATPHDRYLRVYGLQSNNISDELYQSGAGSGNPIRNIKDYGFEIGGPLLKNNRIDEVVVARVVRFGLRMNF